MVARKTSRTLGYILLGFVIVGLIGFGSLNIGGSARKIGTVGETEISTDAYYRQLQSELRAWQAAAGQRPTMSQAQALGLDQRALARVVADAAAQDEARRLGISVSDETVRKTLMQIPEFKGPTGKFDAETYRLVLEQNGLKPADFEADLRRSLTRSILERAVTAGVAMPGIYADVLYAWARQERDFAWARLGLDQLKTEPAAPDEATLKAWYEAHKDRYTIPEVRHVTYIWLKPEALLDKISASDEELRALYEKHADRYKVPERRLVERLVFPSMEEAKKAMEAIRSGKSTFEAEVQKRGLTLSDVDLGDVTRADLGKAADAVFALTQPGLVGPVDTALGPAIFRVNGVLPAQETPFSEVKADLKAELLGDTARRMAADMMAVLDDEMAAGATLEELAADHPEIELGTLDWKKGDKEGIAAHAEVRAAISKAREGDFPQLERLPDGALFAIRLDKIDPPRTPPFDEVRAKVLADWRAEERRRLIVEQAKALLPKLEAGEVTLDGLGLTAMEETGVTRDATLEGAPASLVKTVFEMDAGSWQVIGDDQGAIIVHLEKVTPPNQQSDEARTVKAQFLDGQSQELALDVMNAWLTAIQMEVGIKLDRAAINAVNSQIP